MVCVFKPQESKNNLVLALDNYFFSHTKILNTNYKLFSVKHQYEIFLKIFHRIINNNLEEFQSLGVEKGTLGYHSIGKGAITVVSSVCNVSPPMASICLRSCWSMGPIKDQYIHYEKAVDQFVGRYVTSISSLTTEFGVSLVHWDWIDSPVGSKDEIMAFIEDNFVIIIDVSSPTFNIILFLFSSVCFYYTHLDMHIHKNHHLRESPIFIDAGRAKYLHKFALTRYCWTSTTYTP